MDPGNHEHSIPNVAHEEPLPGAMLLLLLLLRTWGSQSSLPSTDDQIQAYSASARLLHHVLSGHTIVAYLLIPGTLAPHSVDESVDAALLDQLIP